MKTPQPLVDCVLARLVGHAIEFGAVAGREYRSLTDFRQVPQLGQRLLELGRRKGDPFADLERRGAVIDSQDKKRHASVSLRK